MRPSVLRTSKSQDTHDRHPAETPLTTEGLRREIRIPEDKARKALNHANDTTHSKSSVRPGATWNRPLARGPTTSNPSALTSTSSSEGRIVHESMSSRPSVPQPIAIPGAGPTSAPTTPLGKGHAHNPLEDTLFLNIGTGEDCVSESEQACIVSESPSNVDMNVYETAYEEEVQRIIAQRKDQFANRRPTLYLTRRVENVKSIRDSDCVFDEGQDIRQNLKGSFKSFVTRTKEDIEARGEMQKIQEGKEGKLSRTVRNVREAKRLVEEARERVKTEGRDRDRERSRSTTPILRHNSSRSGLSRSGTPVGG